MRNVRGGTLDDTAWLRPTVHFWTRSKQPWITLSESDRRFETQPAGDEITLDEVERITIS